jgi:hypothetical protein
MLQMKCIFVEDRESMRTLDQQFHEALQTDAGQLFLKFKHAPDGVREIYLLARTLLCD